MKSISNSDFSLLMEKLPAVLQYAAATIQHHDTRTANAVRVLALLHRKLNRQNPKTKQK